MVVRPWKPIGFIETAFPTKFATPRQGRYSPSTRARLRISRLPGVNVNARDTLAGIRGFSHVWLLFSFHHVVEQPLRPKIQVPRLGGQRIGVFATRSPHRPNDIGLSLARLEGICDDMLELSGVDLVDGTPVVDIKPYIPAYDRPDSRTVAVPEWVEGAGEPLCKVQFTPAALDDVAAVPASKLRLARNSDELAQTIRDILAADPRPAYRRCVDGGRYDFGCDAVKVHASFRLIDGVGHFTVDRVLLPEDGA